MPQPVEPAADEATEALAGQAAARTGPRSGLRAMDAALVAPAQLGRQGVPAQQRVDRLGDVGVDGDAVAVLDLDDDVEGRRRLALEDATSGCGGGAPPRRRASPSGCRR